jgi:hypothetical protein
MENGTSNGQIVARHGLIGAMAGLLGLSIFVIDDRYAPEWAEYLYASSPFIFFFGYGVVTFWAVTASWHVPGRAAAHASGLFLGTLAALGVFASGCVVALSNLKIH